MDDVDSLEISVDVLSKPVVEEDLAKLDAKKYGIIVTAGDGRQGVLLPDIEGVETVDEQIAICREKGGIEPDEPVEIRKFVVDRHS
jgi:AMMECR1 domain-containing protein